MTTFSILYHRHLARPQERQSELTDKDAALAEASACIFDCWSLTDCNPIFIIDWNAKTINRVGFDENFTAFEVKENATYGLAETSRFQLIFSPQDSISYSVTPSFDGSEALPATVAYTSQNMDLTQQLFCLLDWQQKKLHHVIRDQNNVVKIIQNYPEEPVGILTTYENMEL
jgi:hypothetical protein